MNKIEEMPQHHQFVWTTLQTLEEGERILGPDLQAHTGIKDHRTLFQVIKDLRHAGYLVGGDKSGVPGYYEIRDEEDLERTLHGLRSPAFDLLNTATLMERAFFRKKYGSLLPDETEGDDTDGEN